MPPTFSHAAPTASGSTDGKISSVRFLQDEVTNYLAPSWCCLSWDESRNPQT